MILRRCLRWLAIVLSYTLLGFAIGSMLDDLFWHISFDYIYQGRQFAGAGARFGLLLGAVAAAAATAGRPPLLRLKASLMVGLVVLATALGVGLAAGCAAAACSKIAAKPAETASLAPRTRVWFCEALWMGMAAGAVGSTGIGNYRLIRDRCRNPHNS